MFCSYSTVYLFHHLHLPVTVIAEIFPISSCENNAVAAFYRGKAGAEETEELAYRRGKFVDKKNMYLDLPQFRLVF